MSNQQDLSLRQRYRLWRSRRIADPRFRKWAERFWFTRAFANRQANEMFSITAGFVFSQILYACVKIDLFERLQGRYASTASLAAETGLETGLSVAALERLLQAAENLKLVCRAKNGDWTLDDFGAVIAGDPGIGAMVRHHAMLYRDLADPLSLLTGEKAQTEINSYWAYATASDPEMVSADAVSPYSSLMKHSQAMIAETVIGAYPFGRHKSVLDIGGGYGEFLSRLHGSFPALELNLFDLPPVAKEAQDRFAREFPSARLSARGGDFFKDDLASPADLITLIRICCDHDDDAVLRLLKNIRSSAAHGTKLLIAEAMNGKGDGERLASAYFKLYFTAMRSGECRTPEHLISILSEAQFTNCTVVKTSNPPIATLAMAE